MAWAIAGYRIRRQPLIVVSGLQAFPEDFIGRVEKDSAKEMHYSFRLAVQCKDGGPDQKIARRFIWSEVFQVPPRRFTLRPLLYTAIGIPQRFVYGEIADIETLFAWNILPKSEFARSFVCDAIQLAGFEQYIDRLPVEIHPVFRMPIVVQQVGLCGV